MLDESPPLASCAALLLLLLLPEAPCAQRVSFTQRSSRRYAHDTLSLVLDFRRLLNAVLVLPEVNVAVLARRNLFASPGKPAALLLTLASNATRPDEVHGRLRYYSAQEHQRASDMTCPIIARLWSKVFGLCLAPTLPLD